MYCFICGRRRVAVARYRMICLIYSSKQSTILRSAHAASATGVARKIGDVHSHRHLSPGTFRIFVRPSVVRAGQWSVLRHPRIFGVRNSSDVNFPYFALSLYTLTENVLSD